MSERPKWNDERLDAQFAHIDDRFDHVDERFDRVDERFERLETRFNERFDRLQISLLVTLGSIVAAYVAAH